MGFQPKLINSVELNRIMTLKVLGVLSSRKFNTNMYYT